MDTLALLPGLALLRDVDGRLTLDEALSARRAGDFVILKEAVAGGFTEQTYWLRLRLQRGSNLPVSWWLRLDRGFLDDVRLFHRNPDGSVEPERRAGDRVQALGALDYRAPAFELSMPQEGLHEIYLRVRTSSTMILQPSLAPRVLALHLALVDYLVNGLYFGACLSLMLVGLVAAIWLRQSLALPYLLLVLSATFGWWAISGLAHDLMFNQRPPMADRLIAASISLSGAAGLLFYGLLFELRQRTPRMWWLCISTAACFGLASLAPFAGFDSAATPFVLVVQLASPLMLAPAAVQVWREARWSGRVACISILLYQCLALMNTSLATGVVSPGPWIDLTGPAGNLAHVLSLLLIVVARVRESEASRLLAVRHAHESEAARLKEREAREDQNHLLSMIAHEFRTPVAIIDASLQSLRLLDKDVTPERSARHQRIARAIDRMSDLLELALTRDRLDVSTWQQNFVGVDLAQVTQDAITAQGPAAERNVRVHCAPALLVLQADNRMLRYALLNLIDNALKYSPRDTAVDVSISTMEHDGRPGLLWTILDQGRGISASQAERIFEKYFRAGDNSEVPGIGLGLYLVRQIFQRHQGWVRAVIAGPGNGGCFECWLPLSQQTNVPSAP